MVLQLDPRYPLVWRSPSSLQLGIDRPVVVLEEVSEAQERMLSALVAGTMRPALELLAAVAGADLVAADQLLRSVGPALLDTGVAPPPPTVMIAGRGATVERMAEALASSGVAPKLVGSDLAAAAGSSDVAVIVAHFVIEPDFHGVWLRRDRPHLPVVFGDTGARIGPFIEPGSGPCLWCLERQRTDADAAWPAIASQLWGRRSPLDRGLVASEVAAHATRMLLSRLKAGPAASATSLHLDASTGMTGPTAWQRHPECGCAALPESATVAEESSVAAPPRPRTSAVSAGPA